MPLYDFDRMIASTEKRIHDASYCEENKKLILDFERHLFLDGLKKPRILKYISQLNIIAGWHDFKFSEVTREDIEIIVETIVKLDRKEYTKHDYLIAIKKFFRWMNGGKDPEYTEWIHPKIKNPNKLPEELLTENEIMLMINAATHPRDKAIIALFWDAGGRTGELGNLKKKNIVFDIYGAVAIVDGKTGMRRIRLVFSVPYIAAWLDIHPERNNPDAWLWTSIGIRGRGEQLTYAALRMMMKRTAKKAGINKRVYNHLFRHSRSTDLAQYLTESQMKAQLGWTQDSKMAAIYVHMSGKQIDDAILKMYGIIPEEKTMPKLTTVVCSRCKQVNGSTSDFCSRCGMALKVNTAIDIEKKRSDIAMALMELVEKDPEIAKVLRDVME
jgi:integrase